MRDKFIQMRPLLKDRNVISDCETQIKEYQKYIDYFTEELHRLEAKQSENASDSGSSAAPSPIIQQNNSLSASNLNTPNSEHPPRSSSMARSPDAAAIVPINPSGSNNNKKKYSNLGKFVLDNDQGTRQTKTN